MASALTVEELRVAFFRDASRKRQSGGWVLVPANHVVLRREGAALFLTLITVIIARTPPDGDWRLFLMGFLSLLALLEVVANRTLRLRLEADHLVVETALFPGTRTEYGTIDHVAYGHSDSAGRKPGLWLYDRAQEPLVEIGRFAELETLVSHLRESGVPLDPWDGSRLDAIVDRGLALFFLGTSLALLWTLALLAMGRSVWPGVIPGV